MPRGAQRKGSLATDGRKVCSKCREEKDVAYFKRDARKLDGFRSQCKVCERAARAARTVSGREAALQRVRQDRKPGYSIWKGSRERAKAKGIPHELAYEYVRALVVEGTCGYCRIPTVVRAAVAGGKGGGRTDSPSLDQIVPGAGYTAGNIVVSCFACNRSKGDMSYKEWRERTLALASWMEWSTEGPQR